MIIFIYTFAIVFVALVVILGLGSILGGFEEEPCSLPEGKATAAMCTTRLLERDTTFDDYCEDDFVIEQDLVYTYDSLNI